jgi:hypothetical protein
MPTRSERLKNAFITVHALEQQQREEASEARREFQEAMRVREQAQETYRLAKQLYETAKTNREQKSVDFRKKYQAHYQALLKKNAAGKLYLSDMNTTVMKTAMMPVKPIVPPPKPAYILNLKHLAKRMPREIMDHIASYIMYDTRTQILEKRWNPMSLLNQFGQYTKKGLLRSICRSRYMTGISSWTPEMREQYKEFYTVDECTVRLKFLVHTLKRENPQFAYDFLRRMSILKKAMGARNMNRYVAVYL